MLLRKFLLYRKADGTTESSNYVDSTEVAYGLPARSFKSFTAAAEEAAISRLYGGIHFMPAIVNGSEEGRQVGTHVVSRLNTRKRAGKAVAVKE